MKTFPVQLTGLSAEALINLGNRAKSVALVCSNSIKASNGDLPGGADVVDSIETCTFIVEQILEEMDNRGY